MIVKVVSNNICYCLKETKMSRTDLARSICVTRQTLTSYIEGVSAINIKHLELLALTFNKEIDWFLIKDHTESNEVKALKKEVKSLHKLIKKVRCILDFKGDPNENNNK